MPLSRSTPLNRGTKGLPPGKPLQRKTPIASGEPAQGKPTTRKPIQRTAKARTSPRKTGAPVGTRKLVNARDGGSCVRCGAPATDQDHRQGRGAGGTKGEASARINGAAWLLTLCGAGNTSGCHGWKEANVDGEPTRLGYKLPRNGVRLDAELIPVLTRAGWALFDNDGGWKPCPPPPRGDALLAGKHQKD